MIDLNKMLAIEAKPDALMSRLSNQEKRTHSANGVNIVEGAEYKCADEGLAHESPYKVEEVQYLNKKRSYIFKPDNNLPTHYAPIVRNQENLSYGGGMQ